MKVILAGYNLDTETIKDLRRGSKKPPLTPETIAAAYARISRSPRSVVNLRAEARRQVSKARRLNKRIIFEMSHHSIAEHAVFNFDIIGISRAAVEELEKFRLGSYTEKSQRYVTLRGDYVVPPEIKERQLANAFEETVRLQNDCYRVLYRKLRALNFRKNAEMARRRECHRTLENWSKEDARYVLSLATQTQLGVTVNGRNLELMIRRFASHRSAEVRRLGESLYRLVKKIAPSIILFYRTNDYDRRTYPELAKFTNRILGPAGKGTGGSGEREARLVDCTPHGDEKILAALLFKVSGRDYGNCRATARRMNNRQQRELLMQACRYMELYDTVPREFECVNMTFVLMVSAGCFGQLKRHRLLTALTQEYDPQLGVTVPPAVAEAGAAGMFREVIERTETVYRRIEMRCPGVGVYILTNAHRRRVAVTLNLRELYHMSRLREDPTAQWDIRNTVGQMTGLARQQLPVSGALLGGKSSYPEIYRRLYGRYPKIKEVPPVQ